MSFTASKDEKWHSHVGRSFSSFKQNLTFLPYNTEITFLGLYWNELNTYVHAKLAQGCLVLLFIITKIWKQPRYLSVGEWINNLYTQTVEYYSMLKNELPRHEKGRKLISQSKMSTYCMIPIICDPGNDKTVRTVKRKVVTKDWWRWGHL